MKVSELKEILNQMKDDDEIFALIFDKESFDFDPDDEMWLPPEKWAMLVAELEAIPFESLRADVFDAVYEYGEMNPKWEEEEKSESLSD